MFYRWHHSRELDAIDKNFAGLFPVFDLMFGTFFMPEGRQPKEFGLLDKHLPTNFRRHLVHPVRHWRSALRPLKSLLQRNRHRDPYRRHTSR